jgi:hypothetical protein
MLHKVVWFLRWATGIAIGLTAAIWIVAVLFALLGFRRTAERLNDVVLHALPADATLLTLLVVALLVAWLTPNRTEPPVE